MRTTTISKEVAEGSQDVRYTEVMSVLIGRKKHKLRVRIRSDFYREQCFAYIERWSGTAWGKVHVVEDMKTKTGLHGLRKGPTAFKTDRDELVRVAERILA